MIARDTRALAAAIGAYNITHLAAVPLLLEHLARQPRAREDLRSLRYVVSSGDALTYDVAAQLLAVVHSSCTLLNIYGCTEVSDFLFKIK